MWRDCHECRFFYDTKLTVPVSDGDASIGECRRNPPGMSQPQAVNTKRLAQLSHGQEPTFWTMPIVYALGASCGEFIELTPAQYKARGKTSSTVSR